MGVAIPLDGRQPRTVRSRVTQTRKGLPRSFAPRNDSAFVSSFGCFSFRVFSRISRARSGSLPVERLVQVVDRQANVGVGGKIDRVQLGIARALTDLQVRLRGLRIGAIRREGAVQGAREDPPLVG